MLHVVILASLILPDVDKDIQIEVALSRHNQYEEAVKCINMDIEVLGVETPPSMGKERPFLSRRNKQVFHVVIKGCRLRERFAAHRILKIPSGTV